MTRLILVVLVAESENSTLTAYCPFKSHFGQTIYRSSKLSTPKDMKLKELESALGYLDRFENPKIELEQYNTSGHLAACILHTAYTQGDIADCVVADVGTGSGIFAIGAALLGSAYTLGLDCDEDALALAQRNASLFDNDDVTLEFVRCNLTTELPFHQNFKVDTVLMNPPFGCRQKGIDMVFLEKALRLSSNVVYSLHKTSTRKYIVKRAKAEWHCREVTVVAELRYDLPKLYGFHKQKTKDIQVDLLRFVK